MAVKIRLKRVGAKGQPSYRIVVADSRMKRDGRVVAEIGHYDPKTEPATIVVKEEQVIYWLQNGAQPTDVAKSLLQKAGVWQKAFNKQS